MSISTERKRGKRIKARVGDFFAVDLDDGSWGLGHIVAEDLFICCALFAARAESAEALRTALNEGAAVTREPIGLLVTNTVEIQAGTWPLVGHLPPHYPALQLPMITGEGASQFTVRVVAEFLEAYHGLRAWNEWPELTRWYRDILLPHLPIPPTARFQGAPSAAPAPAPKPPPVTEGPALVTLQIVYPGDGMPSTDLLRKRQDMERRLEAEGAGEIEGAESGAGVMEVYLRTDEVRRTLPLVEKIAAELGFADDMLIETAPVEDDDKEDEDDANEG